MEEAKRIVMVPVYAIADNIISPLGESTQHTFARLLKGDSGISQVSNTGLLPTPFYAAMFATSRANTEYTRFENLCIQSVEAALAGTDVKLSNSDTLWVLTTTKGNVELIESEKNIQAVQARLPLQSTAKAIAARFKAANTPVVVSNACTSGVLGIILAARLLRAGAYKNVVVTGADVLSQFVISGFQSLHAMSGGICRPFDKQRDGINLGECAATVVLTTNRQPVSGGRVVEVMGGCTTNDANHISGPSRTGHELAKAAETAMAESNVTAGQLSFISAHGTATLYNDEMEAKAFNHAGLAEVPLNSLKGYFGHTLGAAGVVESVITIHSLLNGLVLPSRNFEQSGVSQKVNVNQILVYNQKKHALKTASGFGGCNAAVVFSVN